MYADCKAPLRDSHVRQRIFHPGYHLEFGSPGEVSKYLLLFSHWLLAHKLVSLQQLLETISTRLAVLIPGGNGINSS